MRHPDQAASVVRQTLFESDAIRINSFVAHPVSDACGDVERQSLNVVVLPFAGVFSKHDTPGRYIVGTPSHAVFIASETPYRIGFPGAIGDRAIILRFDDALAPDQVERRQRRGTLGSRGLLSAGLMMRRELLRQRLTDPAADPFEVETLSLELLSLCLGVLRDESLPLRPAVHLRRLRAIERVKEAVAVAPAKAWSVARLATIANLSSFHLCHVFRELVGTSIYEYVLRERLARALNSLLDSGDNITEIALDAGFSSHSHFAARFLRYFGCTPSALRRTMNSGQIGELRKIMIARARVQV
jgi:AraC-like DNA-binding protein